MTLRRFPALGTEPGSLRLDGPTTDTAGEARREIPDGPHPEDLKSPVVHHGPNGNGDEGHLLQEALLRESHPVALDTLAAVRAELILRLQERVTATASLPLDQIT